MIGNMNMLVPMVEMCKIPFVGREVLKVLKVTTEASPCDFKYYVSWTARG
jgi:hypothetical protein